MGDAQVIGALCYFAIALVFVVASASWMINVTNSGRWLNEISDFISNEAMVPQALKKSWEI